MASNRRKQDEKHLAILRNLVSLPGNKHCFDCSQRGPTYVNTTIGSFVCTKCSGMLRGLTPPHRIKSISMATFTPEEVESLRNKGNDFCRKVWLALYDSNNENNTKDEQHIQDFMSAKYEKKRYFIEPSPSLKNGNSGGPHNDQVARPSADIQMWPSENTKETPLWPRNNNGDIHSRQRSGASNSSHVENWPQTRVVNSSPPAPLPPPVKPPPVQAPNMSMTATTNMFTPDRTETFKFPPVGEPFGFVDSAASANTQPSFANFDDNPIFSSPPAPSIPLSSSFPSALRSMKPAGEDKYAALKDLDCMMKMQNDPPTVSSSTSGNEWGETLSTSNPFAALKPGAGTSPVMGSSPNNPFRSGFDVSSAGGGGASASASTSPNQSAWGSMPSSHTMSFPVTWNIANLTVGPSRSANPFL